MGGGGGAIVQWVLRSFICLANKRNDPFSTRALCTHSPFKKK